MLNYQRVTRKPHDLHGMEGWKPPSYERQVVAMGLSEKRPTESADSSFSRMQWPFKEVSPRHVVSPSDQSNLLVEASWFFSVQPLISGEPLGFWDPISCLPMCSVLKPPILDLFWMVIMGMVCCRS